MPRIGGSTIINPSVADVCRAIRRGRLTNIEYQQEVFEREVIGRPREQMANGGRLTMVVTVEVLRPADSASDFSAVGNRIFHKGREIAWALTPNDARLIVEQL